MNFHYSGRLDVGALRIALLAQPELFGRNVERVCSASPHRTTTDIWVRYNDRRPFDAGARPWSEFNDEHEGVWYPEADSLPVREVVFNLMRAVQGERLGGVLITKLPPGQAIEPHVDAGWHAQHYEKFYVAVQNEPGSVFGFPEGEIHAASGEVYWFRNDVTHWVRNDSPVNRLSMIVCIRRSQPWA